MMRQTALAGSLPGGLYLAEHKTESNGTPIQPGPLPERLWIPLQQHSGAIAEVCVQPGDRVGKGQRIAQAADGISASLHASTSGMVREIAEYPVAHPSGLTAPCIVLDADGADTWADLPAPVFDYISTDPDKLWARIQWAGVVGLGGALFPTSVKTKAARTQVIEALIINAAECEPYITCDDRLIQEAAAHIVCGIAILQRLVAPQHTYIGIEDNKPVAIAALQAALDATGQSQIQLKVVPTKYPSGGEKQLIYLLTGQQIAAQVVPMEQGVLCQNVATCAAIADAVLQGQPLISRVVTLTGQGIAQPGNYRVRIGTRLDTLVAHAGGYQAPVAQLLLGGPMMGIPLTHDQIPITKGSNCFIAATAAELPTPPAAQPCIRCGACVPVCPANLLPQQLYWHARAQDLDKVAAYHVFDCIECGCCAAVCPAHIPLVDYYRYAKTAIRAAAQEQTQAAAARQRHDARHARLARLQAERQVRLRKKQAALEQRPRDLNDPQQAAITAAIQRVAAKKAAQQNS